MEAPEKSSVDESYYCIEYLGEESLIPTPDDVHQASAEDGSHPLIQRQFEHRKGSYFFCTTCQKSYLNVEDYIECHQINAEEEKAIYDLIEFEAVEDSKQDSSIREGTAFESEENHSKNIDAASVDKYFCYDCRTVFKELNAAEQHDCPMISTNASEEESLLKFVCAFCEIIFKDLASLEQHQIKCFSYKKKSTALRAHNEKFQCTICDKVYPSLKAFSIHCRSHEQETTCSVCNIKFSTNKRLKLHMKIHAEQPQRSIQEALPEIAKKEYSRSDRFFCEICNKSFDLNLLVLHKNMHQNVEKYICDLCNRHFDSAQSYSIHQQRHKAKNGNLLSNSIRTGVTEAQKRNAKNGIVSTHVSKAKQTYPCQYCGHIFWRPFEKTRHERVHTGEKPYSCEICGKRFRVPYSLTLHLRTHTDLRPFVCPTCNKRFKSQSVYSHHLRTHLNDRAYICDLCEKSFRTSVQLNAHKNIHSKPFNCTVCNRPFASLHAVKMHMKSHEKGNTQANLQHRCEICGAIYARIVYLRAHVRDHHGVEITTFARNSDFYGKTAAVEEGTDESEVDAVAALLITAATDAEAREEQRQQIETQFSNAITEADDEVDEVLSVDQEFL